MKISTYALAFALAGIAVSAPAMAQYGKPPPPSTGGTQQPSSDEDDDGYKGRQEQTTIRSQSGSSSSRSQDKAAQQQAADKLSTGKKLDLSKEARNAIVELQNAVNANDVATIPAKLAAAQAVAKTNDDKYIIAVLQTKAATAAGDLAGMRTGIDALRASGGADPADLVARYNNLGKRHYDAKQFDQAAAAFDAALAVDANNADSLKMLASIRESQGRDADAASLMARSFVAARAAGAKPKENDYKFAARVAYDAKAPVAGEITRAWLADYPNPSNWRDALRIYRDLNRPQGDAMLDLMRLARAAGALAGESDYHIFASELVAAGRLAEAKAVLDSGGTKIDRNKQAFKDLSAKLTKLPARAAVDTQAKTATTAKAAITAGDDYYGLGAFAEAAAQYRAALGKSGVDSNQANLRLGMALAQSGDKAGATAALNAVGGAQANVAKYWLIWTASRP